MDMRGLQFMSVIAALSVSACNSAQSPQASAAPPPPAVAASPEGTGCEAVISRYRSVIENDRAMGHVNLKVYDQISGEIGEAQSACSSGQEARAVAMVRASKSRHGYPG
jgi:hypothetical protein